MADPDILKSTKSPLQFGVRINSIVSYLLVASYWSLIALSFNHKILVEFPLAAPFGYAGFAFFGVLLLNLRWRLYSWLRSHFVARVIIAAPLVVYFLLLLLHGSLLYIKTKQMGLIEPLSYFNIIFHGVSVAIFTFTWLGLSRLNDAILLQSVKGKNFIAKNGVLDLSIASLLFWFMIIAVMLYTDTYQQSLFFVLSTFLFLIVLSIFIYENLIRQVKIFVTVQGEAFEELQIHHHQHVSFDPYYFESHLGEYLLGNLESRRSAIFVIRNVPLVDKVIEIQVLAELASTQEQKDDLLALVKFLEEIRGEIDKIENRYEFLERSQDIQLLRALVRIQIERKDINVIIKALNDTRKEIRKSAILVAGYLGDSNFIPQIIQSLDDAYLFMYARYALILMNEKALKYLEVEFYKNRTNAFFAMNVISTVAELDTEKSRNFLLDNLYEPNQNIQLFAIKKIVEHGIKIQDTHAVQIKLIIENLIANYIFIQNACIQIKSNKPNLRLLLNSLNEEKEEYYQMLQDLLKCVYNPFLVERVFTLLGLDDFFSKYFGLNFLELHFSTDLKNKLRHIFAYHDGRYDFSKVRDEFLGENLNKVYKTDEEMLMDIIKRGYNKISHWSKASALMSFVKIKPTEINEEFTAEFFSSNELLRELSSLVIYRHFIDEYLLLSFRLKKSDASRLEYLVKDNLLPIAEQSWNNDNLLKFNKIFFLSNLTELRDYSNRELVIWEKMFEVKVLDKDLDNVFIPFGELSGYWIVESGEMKISVDRHEYIHFEKGDIIDMSKFDFSEIGSIHIKKNGSLRYLLIDELAFVNLVPLEKLIQSTIRTIQPATINQKFEEMTMKN